MKNQILFILLVFISTPVFASGFANGSGFDNGVKSSGSGTPGGSNSQIQYNSSGSFAGSTVLTTDGTNIGIGSTNPGQILDVGGTIRATSFTAGTGMAKITGDSNGNVGINSASPGATLDIQGTLLIIRSPNGTLHPCGPNNSGTWVCS